MLSRIYPYRYYLLAVNLILIAWAGMYLDDASKPMNELKIWFMPDDVALVNYQEFNETFGNDRVIIACNCREFGIFTADVFQEIRDVIPRLEQLEGVRNVVSVTNAKDIIQKKEGNRISINFGSHLQTEGSLGSLDMDSLGREILHSEFMVDRFVNRAGTCFNLVINLNPINQVDNKRGELVEAVQEIIGEHISSSDTYFGGLDIVTVGLDTITTEQFVFFVLVSFGFMILLIAILYKRLLYLVYSFTTATETLILVLGIYGYLGNSLNVFTIIIPPFLIVLGVILMVHIINALEGKGSDGVPDRQETSDLKNLDSVLNPCFFASLTTTIGLLSLLSSSTQVLKSFGIYAALGVSILFLQAFFLALFLIPFLRQSVDPEAATNRWLRYSTGWSASIYKYQNYILGGIFIVLLISIRGSYQMKVDMWPLGYFPENHEVMQDHRAIIQEFGEYMPLDVELVLDPGYSFYDRSLLKGLRHFFDQMSANEDLANSLSYYHLLDRFSKQTFDMPIEQILEEPFLVNQFKSTIQKLQLVDQSALLSNQNKARITLIGPLLSTAEITEAMDFIDDVAQNTLPNFAEVRAVGFPILYVHIMDYAISSMRESLLWAMLFIFLLMLLLYRSFKKAIIALIPNVFTIVVLFGFLAMAGINLDLATATLAVIVLGVSIDDTIHFLYYYEFRTNTQLDRQIRLQRTTNYIGRIITMTSIILILGFSIMLFAGLKTVFYFGLLMVFSGVIAIIGDLILLPILILKLPDAKKRMVIKQ